MEERNNAIEKANKGHGMQGIDKAPGEETSQDNVQFQHETQKGQKLDADLEQAQDRTIEQNVPD
ncbi:MAG: hypothetical protein C4330_12750 [Chitinophagaceae bacterium]